MMPRSLWGLQQRRLLRMAGKAAGQILVALTICDWGLETVFGLRAENRKRTYEVPLHS